MADGNNSETRQAMFHEADVMFGAQVAALVVAHRGLVTQNPDHLQARADLQAYITKQYDQEVLAALLTQAVIRIADLEDLMKL